MRKRLWLFTGVLLCLIGWIVTIAPSSQSGLAASLKEEQNLAAHTALQRNSSSKTSLIPIVGWLLTSKKPESITASVTATPNSGTVPLSVSFSASTDGPVTSCRWDFDGDTIWDWQGITAETRPHVFTSPGTYTSVFQAEDGFGNTVEDQVAISVSPPPPTVTFTSDALKLLPGHTASLSWQVTGAESIEIDQGIGTVSASGDRSITPSSSTLYTLTATGPGGVTSASVDIHVLFPAAEALVVYINTPVEGETVAEDSVTVCGVVNQPTAQIWVNGEAAAVAGETFSIEVDLKPGSNTLSATASWNGLLVRDTLSIIREFTREEQPEGSFGEKYADLIPDDSGKPSYDKTRFSVITGLVEDELTAPLAVASISIKNHPEYGTALTDEEGRFSLPVEGGTKYTLVYEHTDYLTAQRTLDVPVNDITLVDLVRLVVMDSAVTSVAFNGDQATITTHEGSMTSDSDGDRSMTMVFQGDNHAWELDKNGQKVRELTSIDTRATEFSTPETMPSVLPPNSAFTYCAELSVDGVERIEFDNPVVTWVDNFLGFDVGTVVPVGYYDRDAATWIPSENGVVVQLLDDSGDGIVDGIDATGDGAADDLDGDTLYTDEVLGLDDPVRYSPGSTFWRVEVSHFTPWDHNWPYLPPTDAVPPNPESEPEEDEQGDDPEKEECDQQVASSIEPRSRIFHEDIPVPGTNFSLHYTSNRVSGYAKVIHVPVSGSNVPDSLLRIRVVMEVAGRKIEQILTPPLANREATFIWDGRDYLGRLVETPIDAHISIGFVYSGYYASPDEMSEIDEAFAQPGLTATLVETREEITVWKQSKKGIQPHIGVSTSKTSIAQGWSLSSHHLLNLADHTLLRGDGVSVQNVQNSIATVNTFAGGGSTVYTDGAQIQATDISFGKTGGIVFDSHGNGYISTWTTDGVAIWKVDPQGLISRFAGSESYEADPGTGDGGPALDAALDASWSLAVDHDDNIYAVEWGGYRVRKIDSNGIITTVVGNYDGTTSVSNDDLCRNNCLATENTINRPQSVRIDGNNNLYVAGWPGLSISKVSPDGILTTIAGACEDPDCYEAIAGAGQLATDVQIWPTSIEIGTDGSIYFTSTKHWIGKIDNSGVISVVAGTGVAGFSGDGGLATSAQLDYPTALAIDENDNIYVVDSNNNRIRKITPNGYIVTIAGGGSEGFAGDGESASNARFAWGSPQQLTLHDSALYVADKDNYRVRVIQLAPERGIGAASTSAITIKESNGLSHLFSASGQHNLTVDFDTNIPLATFSYNTNGRLTGILNQFGQEATIQYDSTGKTLSITSPEGLVTNLTVDEQNMLNRITYPDSQHFDFTYSQDGLLVDKTEPAGNTFTHVFDDNGRLTGVTDQEEGSWSYSRVHSVDGIVTAEVTTAENNTVTYVDETLFSGGSSSTITYPSGNRSVTSWSHDGLNKTMNLSCGLSQTTGFGLDPYHGTRFTEEEQLVTPGGLTKTIFTSRTYQDTDSDTVPDLITATITTNGNTRSQVQNILTSQNSLISAEGRVTTMTYDPATLSPVSVSLPGIAAENYQFDSHGRLTAFIQDARTTSMTYTAEGFRNSITMPGGQTATFGYDPVGRLTSITRPGANVTSFNYDGNGNLTTITTPKGNVYTYTFNGVNKTAGYSLPDGGGSYSYSYDKERRPVKVVYPSGGEVTSTYTDNRLTSLKTSEGDSISRTYFPGNKVQQTYRDSDTLSFTYDGQLVTSTVMSGTLNQTLSMTYNNNYLLTSLNYAGATQAFNYDRDSLLTAAGSETITRNAVSGHIEQISDTVRTAYRSYNGYGEIGGENITVNSVGVGTWNITSRNPNGKIVASEETFNGSVKNYSYGYDDLGRLLTVNVDGSLAESYQYDANGNRISDLAGLAYVYDSQDRLLSKGTTSYAYTADGFLLSKTEGTDVTSYSYSLLGELKQVNKPDGTIISYTYDALGRRITKSINGTLTEKYLWGNSTTLLAIYDGSDNLLLRFEYADRDVPLTVNSNGTLYYYIADYLGSLRLLVDGAGAAVKEVSYDSFGNILIDSNPGLYAALGFAGGLYDPDTGLLHFAFRDYDPSVGRWTARDPISFAGGTTNLYSYAGNDPVNFVDRNGLAAGGSFGSNLGFSKDMLKIGADYLYDTARALAKARFDAIDQGSNDPCHEQNLQQYMDALRQIEKLKIQGENWSEIFEVAFGAANDVQDIFLDAVGKVWQMSGTKLSEMATDIMNSW